MSRASEKVNTEELRTALSDVGMLMRLPAKRPTAELGAAAPPPRETREGKSGETSGPRRRIGALPVVAAVLVVIASTVYLWPKAPIEMPAGLKREWVSNQAAFSGRRLRFTADTVYMTIDPAAPPQAYAITALTQIQKRDATKLVVAYDDGGGPMEIEAELQLLPTPRLIFARPEGLVWEPATAVPRATSVSSSRR